MARPRKFDETTRKALIKNTAEQILAGGVESVSLRPLAAKHGCSTTAIYTMFGSRDGLIDAVREEAIVSYLSAHEMAVRTGEPVADMRALARSGRRWALEFPALYNVILGKAGDCIGARRDGSTGGSSRAEFANTAMQPMYRLVRGAIDKGIFHDLPVEVIGATLWVGVHGWIAIEMSRPVLPDTDADAAFDRHVLALLRAWCARTPLGE